MSEPDRANFCDWFSLDPRFRQLTAGEKKNIDAAGAASAGAKAAFNDLFKQDG